MLGREPRDEFILLKARTDSPFILRPAPALDGLRGFAVLAVVMFHSKWNISGYFGVDVFFVLSGFLISSLLLKEWNASQTIDFKNFYFRRALRLLPALFVLLTACFFYETFYRAFPGPSISRRIFYSLTYTANWIWAFDAPRNPLTTLSGVWSLAIEEQFYFVWPAALYLLLKYGRKRIALVVTVGILAVMAQRFQLWRNGAELFRISIATDSHADTILIGCLLAVIVSNVQISFWRRFDAIAIWAGPLIFIALVLMVTCFKFSDTVVLHFGYTIIGVLTSAIILLAVVFPSSPIKRTFERPVLVWIGRLSYGIYLWHGTSNLYVSSDFPGVPAIGRIMIGFFLAGISYYLVERPCLRFRDRFSDQREASSSVQIG